MDLSIIIPAWNEAARLPSTLRRIQEFFAHDPREVEIIVVDDGSTDATVQVAEAVGVRVLRHDHNRGKGAAVQTGMLAATGNWRLLSDADLSTPIEEVDHLLQHQSEAKVIIGSRRISGAQVKKAQAGWKVSLGRLGNFLIQMLLVRGIQDTQCGFKLFHQDTIAIFRQQRIMRYGYDFELLYLAHLGGWKIKEVPVVWINDDQSKVRLRDYFQTLKEVFLIHLNRWRGYYHLP